MSKISYSHIIVASVSLTTLCTLPVLVPRNRNKITWSSICRWHETEITPLVSEVHYSVSVEIYIDVFRSSVSDGGFCHYWVILFSSQALWVKIQFNWKDLPDVMTDGKVLLDDPVALVLRGAPLGHVVLQRQVHSQVSTAHDFIFLSAIALWV